MLKELVVMEFYLGNSSFSDKSANSVVRHGESFSSLTCSIETGSDVRCAHSGSNHLRVKREKRWLVSRVIKYNALYKKRAGVPDRCFREVEMLLRSNLVIQTTCGKRPAMTNRLTCFANNNASFTRSFSDPLL